MTTTQRLFTCIALISANMLMIEATGNAIPQAFIIVVTIQQILKLKKQLAQ
jgi:hypothetical protein